MESSVHPEVKRPGVGQRRYRALVAYHGGAFRGFAPNPGVATVSESLSAAIERVLSTEITIVCAGRTDAGVHGRGQVISFDGPDDLDTSRLQHSLNRMLAPGVAVRELEVADPRFDARHSATSRTYRYLVLNGEVPDPFLHATAWHVRGHLDVDPMNTAGQHLIGTHDFASFCRRKLVVIEGVEKEAWLTRQLLSLEWRRSGDELVELWITATAFCQQMVRAIAGTLVEVGLGKRAIETIPQVLEARDRSMAGSLAPPHGLTLWSVGY